MAVPEPKPKLSEAEYLALERAAEAKSEFLRGEMFAMAGGSPAHSRIIGNLHREIGNKLGSGPCATYSSDLRIKSDSSGHYCYPDLSVICGQPEVTDAQGDTATNPILLVEVLSESTESYDRGKKFESYRVIPSLREYLLVSQWEPAVELFSRGANNAWQLSEESGLDHELFIPALGIRLSLRSIFQGVEFPPPPPYVLHDRRRA